MAHPMVVPKSSKSSNAIQEPESALSEFSTQELYRELIGRFNEGPNPTACWLRPSASSSRWPF